MVITCDCCLNELEKPEAFKIEFEANVADESLSLNLEEKDFCKPCSNNVLLVINKALADCHEKLKG